MRAAQFSKYGGPEIIEINKNAQKPLPGKDQVLVEVHAASISPFDYKLRLGYFKGMIKLNFPFTMGGDFSGVVSELGEGVSMFKVGDSVFGQALVLNGGSGAFADFAASNVENTSLMPENVDFLKAAALPLVGASAIQALEEHIKLKNREKILIHGGSGGIGTIAIQLAKYLGAYVVTTVRGDKKEYVGNLGADEMIDYKTETFEDLLHDFDAVFDTVGGEITNRSFKVLKKGGILVSMLGAPNPQLASKYGVRVIGQNTNTNAKKLERLRGLVDQGVIKPQIDKVFPLTKVSEAFEYLEKGHPTGKVVLEIKIKS